MREKVERRVANTENRAVINTQNLSVMRARIEMVETESTHLREDVDEYIESITSTDAHVEALEARIEVIESVFSSIRALGEMLSRVINALCQFQAPPPPP